jgi:hypothetical protein
VFSRGIQVLTQSGGKADRNLAAQGRCSTYKDLGFTQKHEVASELRDYLVREKRRLDAANPLFKELSREAEGLVSAISSTVNAVAPIADLLRAKLAAAAKARRAEQNAARPRRMRRQPRNG